MGDSTGSSGSDGARRAAERGRRALLGGAPGREGQDNAAGRGFEALTGQSRSALGGASTTGPSSGEEAFVNRVEARSRRPTGGTLGGGVQNDSQSSAGTVLKRGQSTRSQDSNEAVATRQEPAQTVLGDRQTSGRRRQRSAATTVLGLASTTKKRLLGQ